MLFTADAWPGIADGSITLTLRTWTRPQARTGGHYRIAGMLIEATDVGQVDVATISEADAARTGAASVDELRERLGGNSARVWRVEFRYVGPDDRIARRAAHDVSDEALDAIVARLQRFDRGAAWTRSSLQLIERYPGVVSTVLARHIGKERQAFKNDIRKLKELGLTESLDIGYRLSPLGELVLRRLS